MSDVFDCGGNAPSQSWRKELMSTDGCEDGQEWLDMWVLAITCLALSLTSEMLISNQVENLQSLHSQVQGVTASPKD